MTSNVKQLILATAVTAISSPVFAAADFDINSMSCEEYNQLGGSDRDKVAMMAILELNDNVQPSDGTATATASSVGTSATESESATTIADSDGTATATSTVSADDDMSRYREEIAVLNRTCSRNWDARVAEAAAGQFGTR